MRHLIDFGDLSRAEWDSLYHRCSEIMDHPADFLDACKGRVMASLFYEPSTRTNFSFQTAMLRVGGTVFGFADPRSSSVAKGETLKDTVKMVSGYADVVVMRNPLEGAAKAASLYSNVPVINAGDGGHMHPTQTTADLTTMIAISEATPGPIGVNMATYVGYVSAGIPGSIIAPLGLVTPAVIIILLVSKILNTLWQNPKVKGLFYALRPASVGLIGAAAFSVCAVSLFSTEQGLVLHWPSILLFGIMLTAMNLPKLKELPSVFFIAVAAVVGIVFQMVD